MMEVNVYKPVGREDVFWNGVRGEEVWFPAENIPRVFDENPNETEFRFNINCDGCLVSEGLRIYDFLRTRVNKTCFCNIEGGCHSMAIVLLLAAPKENRPANPNARGLIHEVRGELWESMTADRTEYDKAELEALMKNEICWFFFLKRNSSGCFVFEEGVELLALEVPIFSNYSPRMV